MISKQRILTFLLGCILVRSILVYLAFLFKQKNNTYLLNLLAAVCLVIGIPMILLYFGIGFKSAEKQLEVWKDDDPVVWWNNLRPFHGIMYTLFAVLTLLGYSNTWIILLIDVVVGFFAWNIHHGFFLLY